MIAGGYIPDFVLTNRSDRIEMERAAQAVKQKTSGATGSSEGTSAFRTAKTVEGDAMGCQTAVSTDLARGSFLELVSLLSGRR